MSERLATMRRIAKVQAQLTRMAEWRLVSCEQRLAAIEADRHMLHAFVESGSAVGPLAALALQQTARLAPQQKRLADERDQRAEAALAARRRSKQAESATEALARDEDASDERRALERLMEASVETWPRPEPR